MVMSADRLLGEIGCVPVGRNGGLLDPRPAAARNVPGEELPGERPRRGDALLAPHHLRRDDPPTTGSNGTTGASIAHGPTRPRRSSATPPAIYAMATPANQPGILQRLASLLGAGPRHRYGRVYCAGAPRTGTHSLAAVFARPIRSAHEPKLRAAMKALVAHAAGEQSFDRPAHVRPGARRTAADRHRLVARQHVSRGGAGRGVRRRTLRADDARLLLVAGLGAKPTTRRSRGCAAATRESTRRTMSPRSWSTCCSR